MRYIKNPVEQLEIFSALGSEIRIEILKLLMKNGRMSMNDLASAAGLTNGALTPHIRKLETCGLVRINADNGGHGNLKICEPHLEKMLFVFSTKGLHAQNEYRSHLRVGQYSNCLVYPTCGLATAQSIIGEVDDARFFTHHSRFEADILWFTKGYVEYMMPCIIPKNARITSISVSAEISSEAPGSNAEWPSDIYFSINGKQLGFWTSPGDYADRPGLFTPDWWFSNWNQYGLLKTLTINNDSTCMDDEQISGIGIKDLDVKADQPIYFRIEVPGWAEHPGGFTVFGRNYGNYNQDIEFRITYELHKEEQTGYPD